MTAVSVVVISKDEPALADTLTALAPLRDTASEVLVVDASAGRLAGVAAAHPWVRWIDFAPPAGVRVSIPHQRNAGVRAARRDVVVFTDAGCRPRADWLAQLLGPLLTDGERVTCGAAVGTGSDIYGGAAQRGTARYLAECPTINLAFRRGVFDLVGPFDESFEYGSDTDWSWRLGAAGVRIRNVPGAVVEHSWGDTRRQLKRAFRYGAARARLYRKHPRRLRTVLTRDPVAVVYPVFLLGLPVALRRPHYLLALLVPWWRARHHEPWRTVADHLAYGAGVLCELSPRSGRGPR